MAKQKPAPAAAAAAAANPTTTAAPTAEKLTQKEAVQRAIAAGKDQPSDGISYIKDKFRMELTKQAFSTLKTHLKKAGETPAKRGRPSGSVKAPTPSSKPASATTAAHANGKPHKAGDPAELALAVKHLIAQYGVESVKSMADVFAS